MYINNKILLGKNADYEANLIPKMANRHGIICGASGSGKTITLKVLAESFSASGVPVFLVDVKGDLAGMCKPGVINENIQKRIDNLGLTDYKPQSFPTVFWDVFGKMGHPIRTTVTNIGPKLLSRMLNLSEAQEGVLTIVFKIAEDEGWELIDLKDLRTTLSYIGDKRNDYTLEYGNISSQSIGSIQRNILSLQEEGGDYFFGKPDLNIIDFIDYGDNGYGNINILDAQVLFQKPTLYACFLLYLLTTTYNKMPEVGDLEKQKLVFFFDEAHLLFSEIPPHLCKQITQIVKLIRSKGIGLYFISQCPSDIPDEILAQLGNRVEHVLRSYTKNDEKAIKAAANSFRSNPKFDTEEEIKQLGTGEALVSLQNEKGEPEMVEKVTILPPESMMGAITSEEREQVIKSSYLYNKYENLIDHETAHEKITNLKVEEQQAKEEAIKQKEIEKEAKAKPVNQTEAFLNSSKNKAKKSSAEKIATKVTNSAVNTLTRKIGNEIGKDIWKLFK